SPMISAPHTGGHIGPPLLFVNVLHAELGELGAEAVEVQPQLARAQPLARLLLFRDALAAEARDLGGARTRHPDDAVGVADDDVAGSHDRAGTDDGHVD